MYLANVSYVFVWVGMFLFAALTPYQNETIMLAIFSYVGILTHYLKKWVELTEQSKTLELKKGVPSFLLSVVTATIFIALRDELKTVFVFTKVSSFIAGYSGSSLFFGFIDKKLKDYEQK